MIKLRLASFSTDKGDREIPINSGELLNVAVDRSLEETKIGDKAPEVFHAAVNGKIIPPELWKYTSLKDTDSVLIAPIMKSDGAQLGQLLVIVAVVVGAPYLAPFLGGGQLGLGLASAAIGLISGYVANQLFPPPVIGNNLGGGSSQEQSQMYSITGQSNQVKKYGTVPKVYGRHRIFPVVAANPYVELEPDPNTGELAMYLYSIYDFGLGPVTVEEIKIGNTRIGEFNEVSYNLVDPNKPATSEGEWDDVTESSFSIYKGDISTENVGATIDANQSEGGPLADYQVTRDAASNPDLLKQEFTVNLVNPQGVFAYNASGDQGSRTINMEIYFSLVGEDNWKAYNDLTHVESFRQVGNSATYNNVLATLYPPDVDPEVTTIYGETQASPRRQVNMGTTVGGDFSIKEAKEIFYRGLPKGSTYVILDEDAGIVVGDYLHNKEKRFAQVASIENYSGSYKKYNFVSPTEYPITLFVYDRVTSYVGTLTVTDTIRPTYFQNEVYKEVIVSGKLRITGQTNDPLFSCVKFTPRIPGEYKVRVTRISTTSSNTYQTADALVWNTLNTRTDNNPIVTDKRHTFLEIRIKATGQLNGAIQNLSAVCTSVLDVYDPNTETWSKEPTNNPAWVFCDLLTGPVSKRPIAKSRLHMGSIIEWAEYCDEIPTSTVDHQYLEQRFNCDFILDYDTTLQEVLSQVTHASQASLNIIDGKYGVLLDVNRTTPVQIFTPRNSTDFNSSRIYTEKPHGLRVTYIDPNADWQPSEIVVYDNGYDEETATDFQDLTSFACTHSEQAWRFGRYFLAQNRLRQENISIKVDFEHLICTRGDFVQVTQDVMRVGGTPARVRSVDGNEITIDEALEVDAMLTYGYVFRGSDGVIFSGSVDSFESSTVINLLGSDMPQAGDLIIIGVTDEVVMDCLVKAITPDSDMSATLVLIEKAEEVYDYESTDILPNYEPNLSRTINPNLSPPPEVVDLNIEANSYNILLSDYEYYIDLDWEAPVGAAVEFYEIHLDFGKGYNLADTTRRSEYRYIVQEENLDKLHSFKVLAVSATGKKLNLGEVGIVETTPETKTTPPSDVDLFNSDITDQVLQLTWTRVADLDIAEYHVRFSPDTEGTWDTSTLLSKVAGDCDTTTVQARTGSYSIKAFDFNGNESVNAVYIITTIPQLFGLNVVEENITDFPAMTGSKLNCNMTEVPGSLILDTQADGPTLGEEVYYSEGYYYMVNIFDAGDIYTCRIQSKIIAEGFNSRDLMSNWEVLSEVDPMATTKSSEWDVELQYRSTETFNAISDWATLSDIETIAEGAAVNWTPWRKFLISDVTGRVFQFRIKLISNKPNVTPRVFSASVRVDMPDRIESYNNITIPITGYELTYDGAFYGPGSTPNVQVTIENGDAGDRPSFVSKTLEGFEIVILDSLGNPVERQVDISVKGYGKRSDEVI